MPKTDPKLTSDDRIWRRLRQPFALCECMTKHHECQWEVFDVDAAGCLLCGAIHRCCAETCPLIPTEDSEVCTITGYCVRGQIFAETEYADTVASYNMGSEIHSAESCVRRDEVQKYVEQLLTSQVSRQAYALEVQRYQGKLEFNLKQALKGFNAKPCNVVRLIECAVYETQKKGALHVGYDLQLREQILHRCVDFISFIINACMFFFKMSARAVDIRILVFGLLYLMKSGVSINALQVIPQVQELSLLLPAENTLMNMHGFRPKYITGKLLCVSGCACRH